MPRMARSKWNQENPNYLELYNMAIDVGVDRPHDETAEYDFPTVYDGLRGVQFITRAIDSCNAGSRWVAMA